MATVTISKSPEELSIETGLTVVSNLDDSGVASEYVAGDLVTTQGGNYTIVKGPIPATLVILQKGGFYTVIDNA